MSLIKSISGIRGTIGGRPGEALTPNDIVRFCYAYCVCLKRRLSHCAASCDSASAPSCDSVSAAGGTRDCHSAEKRRFRVVVGRDARISGEMVEQLVCGTLVACGVDVVRCGFASTPTTELAVRYAGADGGIIITASHNPRQWNALKLLNEHGEFLSAAEGAEILAEAERQEEFDFAPVEELGHIEDADYTDRHIDDVLALEAVDADAVRAAGFKVVLDSINSVGGIIMPRLLERLGVECITINGEVNGRFAHNPEPLPANLKELSERVVSEAADLGISVDPDVDRLAFICENGEAFVEENTLVAVADYLLDRAVAEGRKDLHTVSNLSSSRALRDVTEAHGGTWHAAAVGEVNVTTLMHKVGALIGGEGNGGVIYPESHYGRDAMTGVALFLSNLAHHWLKAKDGKYTVSQYKASLPQYYIAKNRIDLSDSSVIERILEAVKEHYRNERINTVDGVKIDFEQSRSWVHLRRSNTEPIIRIYSEAKSIEEAEALASEVIAIAKDIVESAA